MHGQRQKVAAEHYRDRLRMLSAQPSGAAQAPASAERKGDGAQPPGSPTRASRGGVGAPSVAERRAAVDIMARSGGGWVLGEGERASGIMEVAVAIGTDPALTFSAIVPAPPEIEEFIIAGFLRQKPVELVKCETVDLEVPASAEIVLEGYVKLDELRTEGPFGDHTGFYSLEDEYPVFHVTCITHRKNPIYATTIVAKPPMEDAWRGKAVEPLFLPLIKLPLPHILPAYVPLQDL